MMGVLAEAEALTRSGNVSIPPSLPEHWPSSSGKLNNGRLYLAIIKTQHVLWCGVSVGL